MAFRIWRLETNLKPHECRKMRQRRGDAEPANEYACPKQPTQFDSESVALFLIRSHCSITNLVLKWTPISDMQVVELIVLMPALRRLYIEEYPHGVDKDGVPTVVLHGEAKTKATEKGVSKVLISLSHSEVCGFVLFLGVTYN